MDSMCGVTLAALLFIGIGLLNLFAKDLMWELTEWSNSLRGIASERTDWWDTYTTLGGVAAVIFGVVLLLLALGAG